MSIRIDGNDDLNDSTDEKNPPSRKTVDQLKHEDSSSNAHGQAKQETDDACSNHHLPLVFPNDRVLVRGIGTGGVCLEEQEDKQGFQYGEGGGTCFSFLFPSAILLGGISQISAS